MEERVIHGDCFDVLPTLATESIDFVCTSPPYDGMRDYHGFPILNQERRIQLGREVHRLLKPGGICAVVIGDETKDSAESLTTFRWAIEWVDACDFKLFDTLIYCRDGVPGKRTNFRTEHEYILCFLKGDRPSHVDKSHLRIPTKFPGRVGRRMHRDAQGVRYDAGTFTSAPDKDAGTLWAYAASCTEGNRRKLQHTATMPDKLASDLVRCFCPKGGTVLDCFAGSGTTLVAASKAGRGYIGVEISPEFVSIIDKRLEAECLPDIFGEVA